MKKSLSAFAQNAIANRSTMSNRPIVVPEGTLMSRSWDQNMSIWLRNMAGTEYDLGVVIRGLAERAVQENRNLAVLEITAEIPLKSLELLGYGFRRLGDYLEYGSGRHKKTEADVTVISDWDWTLGLLQNALGFTRQNVHDLYSNYILPAFNVYTSEYDSSNPNTINDLLRSLYRDLKKSGRFTFLEGNTETVINHTTALVRLEQLAAQKKSFDLAFVDPHGTQDKFLCFMGVQKVLKPGGLAYVPVNWWSPRSLTERLGVEERVIWNEKVGKENLEDFLVRTYPKAFSIAPFTGAKTLIIKGTSSPVSW